MKTKKILILWVLELLNNESGEEHPITQAEIARKMSSEDYTADRKTVGRNIKALMSMGYPIKKTKNGFYMDKKAFSPDEVRYVVDAVMSSEGKGTQEKEELAGRLEYALTKLYKR